MTIDVSEISALIHSCADKSGFMSFDEFSAVDSLIYKDNMLAVVSLKSMKTIASVIVHDMNRYGLELECEYDVKLMGKSENYSDYEEFSKGANEFFSALVNNEKLLIKSTALTKCYQSMPLKRLARDCTFVMHICVQEDSL